MFVDTTDIGLEHLEYRQTYKIKLLLETVTVETEFIQSITSLDPAICPSILN